MQKRKKHKFASLVLNVLSDCTTTPVIKMPAEHANVQSGGSHHMAGYKPDKMGD
jgi:hypothetical protein